MRKVVMPLWRVQFGRKNDQIRLSHRFSWPFLVLLWIGWFASSAIASSVDQDSIASNADTELWYVQKPHENFFAIRTSFGGIARYHQFDCKNDNELALLKAIGFTEADIQAAERSPKKNTGQTLPGLVLTCNERKNLTFSWMSVESDKKQIDQEYYIIEWNADHTYEIYRVGCVGLIEAAGFDLNGAKEDHILSQISSDAIILTCRNGEVPQKQAPEPQKTPEIKIEGEPPLSEIPRTLFVGKPFDQEFHFESEDERHRLEFDIPDHCSWLDKENQRRDGSRVTRILKGRPLKPEDCEIVIEVLAPDGDSSLARAYFALQIEHQPTDQLIWELPENSHKSIPLLLKNPFIKRIEPIRLILSLTPEYRKPYDRMEIQSQSDNCQWLELKEVELGSGFKRFKEAKLIGKLPSEIDRLSTDNSPLVCDVYVEGRLFERSAEETRVLPLHLKLDYTSLVPVISEEKIIRKVLEDGSKFAGGKKSLKLQDIDCRREILRRLASEDRQEKVIEEVEICNRLIDWGSSIEFEKILPSHISGRSKERVLTRWESYAKSVHDQLK